MTDEDVIRSEAKEVAETWNIESGTPPAISIPLLQKELYRFHTPENKAIFLDEVKRYVLECINSHQEHCPNGASCRTEQAMHKTLFFVKQEIEQLPQIIHENATSNTERDTVFISYSHFDKHWLDRIKGHFKPLENRIDFWEDSKIKPGQKWEDEIKNAISRAKVALLLISGDFFWFRFS